MAKYCPNCGKENDEKSLFCSSCGNKMNPEQQYTNVPNNGNVQQKSKIAAGILGILLGSLGVHNFYLGYTGKAVAQLLLTIFTCGLLAPVSSIWGLIEGIMILTGSIDKDSAGVPLKD